MARNIIDIDGAQGEGGGQVLRTALAVALCRRQAVRVFNIRRNRPKPGLRRQHLVAVEAAAAISGAAVDGVFRGAQEIVFSPRALSGGTYAFDIGSAGSTTLVAQTLLPALVTAGVRCEVTLRGGTHNPLAPPFEFVGRVYLPLLRRMGARAEAQLIRHGFFPAGGGEINLSIQPATGLRPLRLESLTGTSEIKVWIKLANLPLHVAERERDTLMKQLGLGSAAVHIDPVEADGPGNVVMVTIERPGVTELFTGHGRRGVPAEQVARTVAHEVARHVAGSAPVGPFLADQLILPLALSGSGSFVTGTPTSHTRTQAALVERLLGVPVRISRMAGKLWRIETGPGTPPG